jgi:signal transduction histidine kinase/CheY-like chemotaxis protein
LVAADLVWLGTEAAGLAPFMLYAAAAGGLVLAGVLLVHGFRRRSAQVRLVETLRDEIWELKERASQRDRAEAASEAKSRFLATVSHEIRTPLGGILGLADLLRQSELSAEQAAYVEAITTSGSALASLIDEILDFSKIEAGKLTLAQERFDLPALVEGVAELLAPRAQGKGLEIASSIGLDVPQWVIGDAARLRQVLINLAGNGVKFTATGGVGISVGRDKEAGIAFAVADTGPGVNPSQRSVIFEDFEQGDGSTTRRHGGTGLGLAISRRIVARMGGSLALACPPGGGSQFRFVIPLARAEHGRPVSPALARLNLSGQTALIVAQSPFEAPFIGACLEAAGASVVRAETLIEALAVLAHRLPPELILVDCGIGEDGTRQLAETARSAGVGRSIVLFSPFERRAFGQATVKGFDGWLVKPVRRGSLLARLGHIESQPSREWTAQAVALAPPGLRILLAEDNEINALIVRRGLERMAAEVVHARDGAAALELAEAALAGQRPAFDVILMDVRMPGLDGHEAARRIRIAEARGGHRRVRIVALTANAFEEDRQACLAAGIDEFLTKPVDFNRLAQALTAPDSVEPGPQSAVGRTAMS